MIEKIKNIGEKIPEPIGTLIVWVLLITVGFGIVVGLFAIACYCPYGPLIALFVLFVLYVLTGIISKDIFDGINYFLACVAVCVAGCMLLAFIEFFFACFE